MFPAVPAVAPPVRPPSGAATVAPGTVADGVVPDLGWLPFDSVWLFVPAILVGSYLLARLVRWASKRYLGEERGETSLDRAVLAEVHTPLSVTIGLVGIYFSLVVLDLVESTPNLLAAMLTLLVVLWGRASIRIGDRWIEHLQDTDGTYEFAPIFQNLWTLTVVGGVTLLLISIWNLEVTPFLASAGLLGIVLGFAAQDAISNLIGGIALYFDNTYKVGDVIRVEGDMRGTVTDVGIRSTTVLTQDNLLVTVPNSVLNSTQVVNESAPQRHMRLRIPLSAAYGTDYREVEEIVLGVCQECQLIRDTPRPQVLFGEFGDSALIFELRAFINHPLVEKRAIDKINRGVYDAFEEAEITIPFPQRELSFLEESGDLREFDERLAVTTEEGGGRGDDRLAEGDREADRPVESDREAD